MQVRCGLGFSTCSVNLGKPHPPGHRCPGSHPPWLCIPPLPRPWFRYRRITLSRRRPRCPFSASVTRPPGFSAQERFQKQWLPSPSPGNNYDIRSSAHRRIMKAPHPTALGRRRSFLTGAVTPVLRISLLLSYRSSHSYTEDKLLQKGAQWRQKKTD